MKQSEIITNDEPVNSAVNHNETPPRAETTGHFWRMKEASRRRQTNGILDLDYFTK